MKKGACETWNTGQSSPAAQTKAKMVSGTAQWHFVENAPVHFWTSIGGG
jgi:hypothetical protein